MKITINDKSMNEEQGMDKSSVTGVPSAWNDPEVSSGVQEDVQGDTKGNLSPAAGETAGYAGSDVTGGDLTAPQDAGAALDASVQQRADEQNVWQQQNAGEVAAQTVDLKPSPGNPDSGLPHNPDQTDDSNAANALNDEVQKKTVNNSTTEETAATSETNGAASTTDDTARAAQEADDRFLRLVAEFENYKRQAARREQETRERAARSVIEDLLPVLDNFERAVEAARTAKDIESVRIGVEFIAQQFRDALRSHGVEPIPAEGQMFDPLKHDAIEEVPDSGHPEGTVVSEAQRGYTYNGQVLRASTVRVAGKSA